MFKNCKWIVAIEKLDPSSFDEERGNMQFDSSISKNAPRHKRFENLNSNLKRLNKKCAISYYLNSLWEHISWK
jgi:hypothetical protein